MPVTNNGIYIKNSGVNSGNAFWLKGASLTYDINRQVASKAYSQQIQLCWNQISNN